MGKNRVVTKDITNQQAVEKVIKALQTGSLTFTQAQAMGLGMLPIGDYKGYAANWDIDLAVNQPLVQAEQLHILGILDGRLEGHDLLTVTIPLGSVAGAPLSGNLAVPADEVWFINAVRMVTPADNGGSPTVNWHCSLWTDPAATPSAFGQPFHAAGINFTPGGGTQWDEFGIPATVWDATNKPMMLRLPGGTVITLTVINTGAVAIGAMACTLALFGSVGKTLVD